MTVVANYISSLEVDKMNLNTQVQRLSVKNNWLQKSMTENQQLLQEGELALVKTDKHLCWKNNCLRNDMTESPQAEMSLMKTTTDKKLCKVSATFRWI